MRCPNARENGLRNLDIARYFRRAKSAHVLEFADPESLQIGLGTSAAFKAESHYRCRSAKLSLEQVALRIRHGRWTMGIFTWILLGLVVGALAKFFMPGDDPGGIFVTILIGIAGAFLGGFIGTAMGVGSVTGFNMLSILLAIGGAIILLVIYRLVKRPRQVR